MAGKSNTDRRRLVYDSLLKLNERSRLIDITPLEVQPGWPPDKYLIDYYCRSITGINPEGEPLFGEHHQMKIYLDRDYPRTEPNMMFLTPIWHPNISSEEPRRICTDKATTWWAGKAVDELVLQVAELIQYKHYHAKNEPPFPQDMTVAAWVINHAERRGLLGPNHPVDQRPLLVEHRIRQNDEPQRMSRIRLGNPFSSGPVVPHEFRCPGCGLKTNLNEL